MKLRTIIASMVCCMALVAGAKDLKTVVFTTSPEMHCASCENKIKGGLRFEKGVKDIVTNLDNKTVTVKYDADKTNPDKIINALSKIKYTAVEVKNENGQCEKQGQACESNKGCGEGKSCGNCKSGSHNCSK